MFVSDIPVFWLLYGPLMSHTHVHILLCYLHITYALNAGVPRYLCYTYVFTTRHVTKVQLSGHLFNSAVGRSRFLSVYSHFENISPSFYKYVGFFYIIVFAGYNSQIHSADETMELELYGHMLETMPQCMCFE